MLVAPRSATSTWPASARNASWRGGRPPVLGPTVAFRDQPAVDQLADAAGDDRPAEPGALDELGARPRAPEPDLVEDGHEVVEHFVGQRGRAARPAIGPGRSVIDPGMIRALSAPATDFCT